MRKEQQVIQNLRSFARNEHRTKRSTRTEIRRLKLSSGITRGPLPSLAIRHSNLTCFIVCSYQGSELRVYGFNKDGDLLFGDTYSGTQRSQTERTLIKKSKLVYVIPLTQKPEPTLIRSTKEIRNRYGKLLRKVERILNRKPQRQFVISLLSKVDDHSDFEFGCSISNGIVHLPQDQCKNELALFWITTCCFIPQKMQILPVMADLASFISLGVVPHKIRKNMINEWKIKAKRRGSLNEEHFSSFILELIEGKSRIRDILNYLHRVDRLLDNPVPNTSSKSLFWSIWSSKKESYLDIDVGELFLEFSELSASTTKIDLLKRAFLCKFLDGCTLTLPENRTDISSSTEIFRLYQSLESRSLRSFLEVSKGIKRKRTPRLFELMKSSANLLLSESIQVCIQQNEHGQGEIVIDNHSGLTLENIELLRVDSDDVLKLIKSLSSDKTINVLCSASESFENDRCFQLRFEIPEGRNFEIADSIYKLTLPLKRGVN